MRKVACAMRTVCVPTLCLALAAGLGGCYERVVSARGFGSDQYEVSEPYQENSKLDDWVFGKREDPNKTRLKTSSNSR